MQAPLARFTADGATVRLYGEFDLATIDVLRRAVRAAQPDPVTGEIIIAMAGVTFIDSTGIAALLELMGDVEARGHRLCLHAIGPHVMRLLRLYRAPVQLAPAG
jgi:anti-anti-sigma factor